MRERSHAKIVPTRARHKAETRTGTSAWPDHEGAFEHKHVGIFFLCLRSFVRFGDAGLPYLIEGKGVLRWNVQSERVEEEELYICIEKMKGNISGPL